MLVTANGKKSVLVWLYSGMTLVFLMLAVGAITRLTESGLSITEWNVITGSIPPMSEAKWLSEFDKYKETPEYIQKNAYAFGQGDEALANFKKIYWWEWAHRFLGRMIGIVFLIPFIIFWRKKYFYTQAMPRLLAIFILGGFQGFLGWYMVKSGLSAEPRVSHYRLAMHLSTALLTFSLIWWLVLDIRYPRSKHLKDKFPRSKKLWFFSFVLLVIQIIYGAFVAGKDAGQLYNTWPLMEGQIAPESVWAGAGLFDAIFENPATIQFIHRTLAIFVYVSVLMLWLNSRKTNLRHDQQLGANLMLLMVNVQFALGVLTLIYAVPVWLGVLHQAGAAALLCSSLYFIHQVRGAE